MISVKVSFESNLSALAQSQQMQVQLKTGANLDELMKLCLAQNLKVESVIANKDTDEYKAVFVCNRRFCSKNHLLKDGDIVSVYPKVSGG